MQTKTILLIDLDSPYRNALMHVLGREGFRVTWAQDADGAKAFLRGMVPDLILLDAYLPENNAYSFLKWLRQDPSLQNIPVVINTTVTAESVLDPFKELGVSDILIKTRYSLCDLFESIRKAIASVSQAAECV